MTEPVRECPFCKEMVNGRAIKCPRCLTVLDRVAYLRENMGGFGQWLADRLEWSRRQKCRKFLGVCSYLSSVTGMPLLLMRLVFVYLTLSGNHGPIFYFGLFLFLPDNLNKPEQQ